MPQLDTVYTLMVYLWAWLVLYMFSQKIKTVLITSPPQKMQIKLNNPMTYLPW